MEKIQVLYVDDEVFNVTAFVAHFRRHEYFRIFTSYSGEDGLTLLDSNPFHVVISDEKMPGMTGLEFLKFASQKQPLVAGIIVTGKREIEVIEQAKIKGEIFDFHDKPWDLVFLEKMILEAYKESQYKTLNSILASIKKLPIEVLIESRKQLHRITLDWSGNQSFHSLILKINEGLNLIDVEVSKRIPNSEWTMDEI